MSASCRLQGVAVPADLGQSGWIRADCSSRSVQGGTVQYCVIATHLLERGRTRTVTSTTNSAADVPAVSLPPAAEEPADCYNYRQCRDNPPQFYGMLCHEVFAPHSQLHALRDINTPCVAPANTLVGSPGQRGRGTHCRELLPWRQSSSRSTRPVLPRKPARPASRAHSARPVTNRSSSVMTGRRACERSSLSTRRRLARRLAERGSTRIRTRTRPSPTS